MSSTTRRIIEIIIVILVSFSCGVLGAWYGLQVTSLTNTGETNPSSVIHEETTKYFPETSREEKIIDTVGQVSSSVVNITAMREVTVYQFFTGSGRPQPKAEQQAVGRGTGFIVSEDGLVLTNKHVVQVPGAQYKVTTADGQTYSLKVLAKDPFKDLALAQIQTDKTFQPVTLGNSENLVSGQTVIAIGNALGRFQNTISVGVISGLQRTVHAGGLALLDLIQTDAAINEGNSGGPLLNLKGKVIGVNVAKARQAQNIGFAIPINQAVEDIEQVQKTGQITYPFLGVRYISLNKQIQEQKDLPLKAGALIVAGDQAGAPAIVSGSAAEKMSLHKGDIIVQIDGQKITPDHSLAEVIRDYDPGDEITVKYWRDGQYYSTSGELGGKSSS